PRSRASPTTSRKSNPASANSTSSSSTSRTPSKALTPKFPAPRPPRPPAPPPLLWLARPSPSLQPALRQVPPLFPQVRPPLTPFIPTAFVISPAANTISLAPNLRTTSSFTATLISLPTPSSTWAKSFTSRSSTLMPWPPTTKSSPTIPRVSNSVPPASAKAWRLSNSARKPPASANSAKSSSATPAATKIASPAPNSRNSASPSPPPANSLFSPPFQRSTFKRSNALFSQPPPSPPVISTVGRSLS